MGGRRSRVTAETPPHPSLLISSGHGSHGGKAAWSAAFPKGGIRLTSGLSARSHVTNVPIPAVAPVLPMAWFSNLWGWRPVLQGPLLTSRLPAQAGGSDKGPLRRGDRKPGCGIGSLDSKNLGHPAVFALQRHRRTSACVNMSVEHRLARYAACLAVDFGRTLSPRAPIHPSCGATSSSAVLSARMVSAPTVPHGYAFHLLMSLRGTEPTTMQVTSSRYPLRDCSPARGSVVARQKRRPRKRQGRRARPMELAGARRNRARH